MTDTKPKGRIYRFHDRKTGDVTFCRALNPAAALNYVTRDRHEYRVATQDDMVGVTRAEILDATVPGLHPDQQPLSGVQ